MRFLQTFNTNMEKAAGKPLTRRNDLLSLEHMKYV